MSRHNITTQVQIRAAFWVCYPAASKKRVKDHSGTGLMYHVDTRLAFVDFVDGIQRDGQISEALANRATL